MIEVEEKAKTNDLYEIFRNVFNKLTPHKFDSLLSQFRFLSLQIDTQEKMEVGVANLVFEMAISEPDSSVAYALMCKELALMQVSGTNPRDSSTSNFRKLIVTRCQREFEKDSENTKLRETKTREIEECTDLVEKQKLMILLEEEERKIRNRSVGNIRFIGELFKLGMLTKKIMYFCIDYMLKHKNKENLECLSKLLTTIGKNLEVDENLEQYFNLIQDAIINEGREKLSSDVCKMLQEVVELRRNKWEPKKVDSNLKTNGQIQRDNGFAPSKESGRVHKYSQIRKMRKMQYVETSTLHNEPPCINVNNSKPHPINFPSSKISLPVNQNERTKERDYIKQPRTKPKRPNREKRNFKFSYDNLETKDRTKLETLFKEILRVPNTSTPQELENLIEQGRSLQSASQERLLEIIEFIFEKAIQEPSFSCACACICKELEFLKVTDPSINDEDADNFGKIIVSRCKIEFEKSFQLDKFRKMRVKEIEECMNPEKKQELEMRLEEEEKEKRMKSLGNMRFIGELFKQRMLSKLIMHGCIKHLLKHKSEANLERLSKLFTIIGKNLETNHELKGYIEEMQKIIDDSSSEKISLEIRNLIKEVIELRSNKWVSRNNYNIPKAKDKIDSNVEISKFANKPPSIDEILLGNGTTIMKNENVSTESLKTETRECRKSIEKSYNEDRCLQNGNQELSCNLSTRECSVFDDTKNQNISRFPENKHDRKSASIGNKSTKSAAELMYVLNAIAEEYIVEADNEGVLREIRENFSSSELPMFVCEMINAVIEKSKSAREKISKLFSFLLSEKVITLKDFTEGFDQMLDMFDVLVTDIPRIQTYLAEILLFLLIEGTYPISELRNALKKLRTKGESGKLVAKLFSKMSNVSGPKSIGDKWRQSGLQLSDIINPEREKIDLIVRNYKLEFLIRDCEDLLQSKVSANGISEATTDEIESNQKLSLQIPINRSKISKFNITSLSVNRRNFNPRSKSSESLKSASSTTLYEQTRKWKFRNRQKERKSTYDNLNTEERAKLEALLKEMLRETDTFAARKLDSLIDLEKFLKYESPEKLIEIVNFIFRKPIEEPSFSLACALMCKKLSHMRIFNPKHKTAESLRSLIIARCQTEFENYSVEEITKIGRLQMQIKIELTGLEKLQLQLADEEKKMKTKSVTNVKFIGELFKQGVLTSKNLKELHKSKGTHNIMVDKESEDFNSESKEQIE